MNTYYSNLKPLYWVLSITVALRFLADYINASEGICIILSVVIMFTFFLFFIMFCVDADEEFKDMKKKRLGN